MWVVSLEMGALVPPGARGKVPVQAAIYIRIHRADTAGLT